MKRNQKRSKVLITVAGILSTIFLLLSPTFALARAGGGESFGGGGFDSGGSSFNFGGSSSSGSFSGGSLPIFIPFHLGNGGSCCTGLIIFAIIITIIIIITRSRGGRPPMGGSDGAGSNDSSEGNINNRSMSEEELKENLDKLKEIDPKFDEQKFKTYVKKTFMAVQEGWRDRDQTICRPFMAEEIYQSHEIQIEGMKESRIINMLENIVIGSTNIVRIDLGEEYHKIAVKVRASMKDYKINEDTKKVVEGDKSQLPPFTEYWIFIRRSNLKTKIKDGLFDRKCPNCGAPIDVKVSGECKYCNANVVNGDYDWVLSEIVQKSEWME